MYWRLNRAHANTLENLPIFGTMVLVGTIIGCSSPQFSQLAVLYMGGRIGQSIVHILGGSTPFIMVRFCFFSVQMLSVTTMGIHILHHALPALV